MYKLTKEGKKYLENGLPEKNLLAALQGGGKNISDITIENKEIAIAWARRNNWVSIENNFFILTDSGRAALEEKNDTEIALEEIDEIGKCNGNSLKILLSRKLAEEIKTKEPAKTTALKISNDNEIAQLTPDLIKTGKWKSLPFRKYDVNAPAPQVFPGKKQHFVQFLGDIKERLISLGFQEAKGPLVELSFWNCDTLFTPQDHPAKGIHDIFYLKNPKIGKIGNKNLVSSVKKTHENGWITGSKGWGGSWEEKEASKILMRSQTTSVSSRILAEHGDKSGKYFTIDRVFRPDVIDAKHLMEFYQCEGIVIGENLNFKNLLGYLKEFANMIGLKEVRFKPGFFPFTEPSVEGFLKHPKLGWMEVLPAGLFRPEMLKPLGIEKCQVLAWGLGINRLAMIKLGIDDIRQLFSEDLGFLRSTALVR